jgi:hypothetical protein
MIIPMEIRTDDGHRTTPEGIETAESEEAPLRAGPGTATARPYGRSTTAWGVPGVIPPDAVLIFEDVGLPTILNFLSGHDCWPRRG